MDISKELETLLSPPLAEAGVELVALEWRTESTGWVLRLFLDKPGGFGVEDCSEWNDRLGDLVDASGLIHHRYSLEVSSPGLDRPLRKREDFSRFMGLDCVLKTTEPLKNQSHFRGKMTSLEGENLMLYDRTSGLVAIPLAKIARAKLDPQ